jgi:hypothetical protein
MKEIVRFEIRRFTRGQRVNRLYMASMLHWAGRVEYQTDWGSSLDKREVTVLQDGEYIYAVALGNQADGLHLGEIDHAINLRGLANVFDLDQISQLGRTKEPDMPQGPVCFLALCELVNRRGRIIKIIDPEQM